MEDVDDSPPFVELIPRQILLDFEVLDIAMGQWTTCVLAEDKSVWCWGAASYGESLGESVETYTFPPEEPGDPKREMSILRIPTQLKKLDSDNIRIWAGGGHYCVQKVSGHVWCWGANTDRAVDHNLKSDVAPLTRLDVHCDD